MAVPPDLDNATAVKDVCLVLAKADRIRTLQLVLPPTFRVLSREAWEAWDPGYDCYGREEVKGVARRYEDFWDWLGWLQRTVDEARGEGREKVEVSLVGLVRERIEGEVMPYDSGLECEDEMNHVDIIARAVDRGWGIKEAVYDYRGRYVVRPVSEVRFDEDTTGEDVAVEEGTLEW